MKEKIFRVEFSKYGIISEYQSKLIWQKWKKQWYSLDKAEVIRTRKVKCLHCDRTIGYDIIYRIIPTYQQKLQNPDG